MKRPPLKGGLFISFLLYIRHPATIELPTEIERALSPLVGLDLVSISKSVESDWFTFGHHQKAEAPEIELAPFALQVFCPWRLVTEGQVLAGSGDYRRSAEDDDDDDDEDSDWPITGSEWRSGRREWKLMRPDWVDTREEQLREHLRQTCHSVSVIEVGNFGWFRIGMSPEAVLEVFPDLSKDDRDEVEVWRLFQPGLDASHFVVTSNGADRI